MTKEVTRRPVSRIKEFKNVIEEFSLFPKPISITVAENKGDSQDLLMVNGFWKLPTGEFYPRNLFDKIQQATTFGRIQLGKQFSVLPSRTRAISILQPHNSPYFLVLIKNP